MVFELVDILATLSTQTALFLPKLAIAAILLVIGLVLGKVIGRVVASILDRLKLDYYITEKKKPAISVNSLLSLITRWWIYIVFIVLAVNTLEIMELIDWTTRVTAFIPNAIGAALIVTAGYVLAEYIKIQLKKAETANSVIVSKVLFFFILYVAVALALPVLGVSATLVNNILLVIIASVGLGCALALGLGMKEAVADVSKRYAKKIKV
jgi:hypothetical protein